MGPRLKGHLRNIVLGKHARLGVDTEALIEKRHKDAKVKIFSNSSSGDVQPNKGSVKRIIKTISGRRNR